MRADAARIVTTALLGALVGCAPAPAPAGRGPSATEDAALPAGPGQSSAADSPTQEPPPVAAPADPARPLTEADRRLLAAVGATLAETAAARRLAPRTEVKALVIDRDDAIERIIAKAKKETPERVLVAQGELLGALGLLPEDYDFVAGIFALVRAQIAGFYDPDLQTMYLVSDLREDLARETLAHELVHALQDQHFGLGRLIKYTPGDSDRVAAAHALAEGDATSAMLEVVAGSSFRMSPAKLRGALLGAMSGSVPRILRAALVSPYADGYAFVQALRIKGGWAEVDLAYGRLPASSEQLLHLDKYLAGEPPMKVAAPSLAKLGEGWAVEDSDVLGEQVLRLVLEEWVDEPTAKRAAAGWGGDRYVVGRRPRAGGGTEVAVAWSIRFDTAADAQEAAAAVARGAARPCTERAGRGAFAWQRRGDRLVLAAGPFHRDAEGQREAAPPSCAVTGGWATAVLDHGP